MLVMILLSQGGRFTADIGNDADEMSASACVQVVREMLAEAQLFFGRWGSIEEYERAVTYHRLAVVPAYINPAFVAAITTQ